MSMQFEIDYEQGYCLYYLEGTHPFEQILKHHAIFSNQLPDDPNFSIIIDLSHADIEFHLEDLRNVINMNRSEMEKVGYLLKTAMISHMTGLNLIGETLTLLGFDLPLKLGAFNNLTDALRWLGLESERSKIDATLARMAQQEPQKFV